MDEKAKRQRIRGVRKRLKAIEALQELSARRERELTADEFTKVNLKDSLAAEFLTLTGKPWARGTTAAVVLLDKDEEEQQEAVEAEASTTSSSKTTAASDGSKSKTAKGAAAAAGGKKKKPSGAGAYARETLAQLPEAWRPRGHIFMQDTEGEDDHVSAVTAVKVSGDGKHFFSASYDTTVKVWSTASMRVEKTLGGHKDRVTSLAVGQGADGGALLLSGAKDSTVRIYDGAKEWKLVREVFCQAPVLSVALSPDGTLLAAGTDDCKVMVMRVATGAMVQTLKVHEMAVTAVAWSGDGSILLSGDRYGDMNVWDAAQGFALICTVEQHVDAIREICLVPNSSSEDVLVLDTGYNHKVWRLSECRQGLPDAAKARIKHYVHRQGPADGAAFNSSGTAMVSTATAFTGETMAAMLVVRSVVPETGAMRYAFTIHDKDAEMFTSAAVLADGVVLTASVDGYLRVYHMRKPDAVDAADLTAISPLLDPELASDAPGPHSEADEDEDEDEEDEE